MMANGFALMIEGVVALLLVTTICYCFTLNRKLVRLRSDETALRATIAELVTATDIAERAILGFKLAIRDCDSTLTERLRLAEQMSISMADQLQMGQDVLKRIAMIASAARPDTPEHNVHEAVTSDLGRGQDVVVAPSRALAASQAAQALASRVRERRANVAA